MKKTLLSIILATTFAANVHAHSHGSERAELTTYSNIALQNYSDALTDAKSLQKSLHAFADYPTEGTLAAAKKAWLQSRESYGTTEIFRLSNGPIDAEEGWVADAYGSLEGQLNAWPLDEHMIDYTIDADGKKTSGNILDTASTFTPGGEEAKAVDVKSITADALAALNENGGDANVATGYHAIEFLLWGQDQDYANFIQDSITNGATTAGQRPLSDFTTDTLASRRHEFLKAASEKLVNDLEVVTSAWHKDVDGNKGLYRAAMLGKAGDKNISQKEAQKNIFAGMGVYIKSELANERIAVAVLTPSEEDEHSCFSDNTHRDITTNYEGFKNILMGSYKGKKMGVAFIEEVDAKNKKIIMDLIASIDEKVAKMNKAAETVAHFDYQIQPDSGYTKNIVSMKNQMRKLGDMMITVAEVHGTSLTDADVTDGEETQL